MAKKTTIAIDSIDCACVIYGDAYDWGYVDKLYNMLCRNLTPRVIMHVYTEADRLVPQPFVKHILPVLDITDPKRFWWYKICLFDTSYHRGPLLYFDLDTVIVGNIDWIWQKPLEYFWAVHDFKHLWRSSHNSSNTSVMWWDTSKFEHVWHSFQRRPIKDLVRAYHGDQDFVTDVVDDNLRRFLDTDRVQSWRWQSLDGGYDFKKRIYKTPGSGTKINPRNSVLVFHGRPKPADLQDAVISNYWI